MRSSLLLLQEFIENTFETSLQKICVPIMVHITFKKLKIMNWKIQKLLDGETIISKEPGNSMLPLLKSKQPVKLQPISWEDCEVGDIVFCKVRGNVFTHLVKGKNERRGLMIGNNHGRINGWTKNVYGKVIEILPMS